MSTESAAPAATGITALVVIPAGLAEIVHLPLDGDERHRTIGRLVGGPLEAVGGPDWVAYLNAEALRLGLYPNPRAHEAAVALGWRPAPGDQLRGVALFCGRADTGEADVPQRILDVMTRISVQVHQ
jgi:hypothetical protein